MEIEIESDCFPDDFKSEYTVLLIICINTRTWWGGGCGVIIHWALVPNADNCNNGNQSSICKPT